MCKNVKNEFTYANAHNLKKYLHLTIGNDLRFDFSFISKALYLCLKILHRPNIEQISRYLKPIPRNT